MKTGLARSGKAWTMVAVVCAIGACGDGRSVGGSGDTVMQQLADTAALSATAGFVELSTALTDAGIIAMLDEAHQSDSVAAALALDKATDSAVRAFATTMMEDHHVLRTEGDRLAKRLSITPRLPASDPLSPVTEDEMIALRATPKGPEFDRIYIKKEVVTHQALRDFAEQARRSTPNDQIRDFIDRTAPIVNRHLERAEALQKRLALTT
jgi:putative membrane protein